MTRPDACVAQEDLITGALLCTVCWRYKTDRSRCRQFREHGFRFVRTHKGKKRAFGVRYEVKS